MYMCLLMFFLLLSVVYIYIHMHIVNNAYKSPQNKKYIAILYARGTHLQILKSTKKRAGLWAASRTSASRCMPHLSTLEAKIVINILTPYSLYNYCMGYFK